MPVGTDHRGPSVRADAGRRRCREDLHAQNANGLKAKVTEYGATLTELWAPDRDGTLADVVLGYDRLEDYVAAPFFLGAYLGRVANRIANGNSRSTVKTYRARGQPRPESSARRPEGIRQEVWTLRSTGRPSGVTFSYTSPDGEEGYPGTLNVTVTYRLSDANELLIDYAATTDKATPINLTNHSFFNLAGSGTILDHVLTIRCEPYTPVNASLVPTGEIASVIGTPLDFTRPRRIGERIEEMRSVANGYDHNFVLDRMRRFTDVRRARRGAAFGSRAGDLDDRTSRAVLHRQPFRRNVPGRGRARCIIDMPALRFEPQHYPDAINHPEFPSVVLRPGDTFRSSTVYRFTTRRTPRD